MKWSNVWLILDREVRDQLRDRRTLFMIGVLPLILYPLVGIALLKVAEFFREHSTRVLVIGAEALPPEPKLIVVDADGKATIPEGLGGPKNVGKLIDLKLSPPGTPPPADPAAYAKDLIDQGEYDAVVFIPPDFHARIEHYRQQLDGRARGEKVIGEGIPAPQIYFNAARDKSKTAYGRIAAVIDHWRDELVQKSFQSSQIPLAAARPFEVGEQNIAEEQESRAALWSKILPFIVVIWALTGAFYPAIDLCAGEKERGTLETLLSSPAERSEIVFGKLGTVMVFSIATALLNLFSFSITGWLAFQSQAMAAFAIGPPPLTAMPWLIVGLIPIAALFSALSLAIAAMARSTREGQYYLMPLLLSAMPLMMLPMLPTMELDLGTSLIPVTGVMLLLRTLMEGQYLEALRYSVPVVGVTIVCVLFAVRWAIDQFNNEDVLFRESERFDLRDWIVHFVRERGETPSVGEAIFGGLLILMIHYIAGIYMPPPRDWNSLVLVILVTQLALIATPILLMTIILTRSATKTLLLRVPYLPTIPAAILLAAVMHPLVVEMGHWIQQLYPMRAEMGEQAQKLAQLIGEGQSFWMVLGMFALVPAICEELAFRGFIMSGLRHTGHRWLAIAGAAAFFGVVHLLLQQQINAAIVGLVIGYIALKTESILPSIAFHCVNNALAFSLGYVTPKMVAESPWLAWLVKVAPATGSTPAQVEGYHWPVLVGCGLAAAAILWWFKSLPYHLTEEEQLQETRDQEVQPAQQNSIASSEIPTTIT